MVRVSSRLRSWFRAGLVVAMTLQSVLLYLPASGEGQLPPHVDKVGHALMFGAPAVLALLAGWRWGPLALALYAPASEVLQGIPTIGRDPDWHDVVADLTGIVAFAALFVVVTPRGVPYNEETL